MIPPSFNTAPPAAPAQSYGNSPRQLEQRYRTDRIDDPSTGPDSPYSMPTVPPGGAAPPNSVPYNFGSVPPTYSGGGAQMTTPRQLDQRYSTSVMNRADISGSGNGPSSGVTGFLSAYQGEKPAAAKRRSPVLLIVIVLLVLLILIAVGFVVLKASGALG